MPPRLSVVVPIYNVELYLEDCLSSLAVQTMADLEVVMVDDGSADGSTAIAERYAAVDERFTLVRQANGGLGHARNTGVRHIDPGAGYLTFVDSDDVIPPDAYAKMLDSLEASGSDFATGNVMRLRARGLGQSGTFKKPMAQTRVATHITRHHDLVYDRIVCNKVYRRAFWDKHSFTFPEGRLYEDIPVSIPAHYHARSVDVLSDHVYYWREREGSITQARTRPSGLRDRFTSVDGASRFLAAQDDPSATPLKRAYDRSVLASDLVLFMEVLAQGSEEFQELFVELGADFLSRVDPSVHAELPLGMRLKWQLIKERRTADLLDLLAFEVANPSVFRLAGHRGRRAVPTAPNGRVIRVPAGIATLKRSELPLHARLLSADWDGRTLRLGGYAYIRGLRAGRPHRSVKAGWLRRQGSRSVVPVWVRGTSCPEATRNSGQRMYSYDASGFGLRIDLDRLLKKGVRTGTWHLTLGVLTGGVLRRSRIGAGVEGSGAQPPALDLGDGRRAVPAFHQGVLRITVEETGARLAGHRLDGDDLELTGLVRGGSAPVALRLTGPDSVESLDIPVAATPAESAEVPGGWAPFTARVPLAVLEATRPVEAAGPKEEPVRTRDYWKVELATTDGGRHRLLVPQGLTPGRHPLGTDPRLGGVRRELAVTADASGHLTLIDQIGQPLVDTLTWTPEGGLVLAGAHAGAAGVELVWQHSEHREEIVLPVELSDGRFRTEVSPAAAGGGGRPLREGRWYAFFRDARTPGVDAPLRLAPALLPQLPLEHRASDRTFTVQRRFHDLLFLGSGSTLGPRERGAYRQHRLATVGFPVARHLPLRDAVLYNSFDGKQYSDSPRAVHEELVRRSADVEHLWAVRDGQAEVPPTARAVVLGSAEWHQALGRSRTIVGNTHLPRWFRKRPGQTVLQTWHGTPLKRIGHDLAGTDFANPAYLRGLSRRAGQWSMLLSPNRFSTPILRRAFAYEGEILESGYPRNDLLYAEDRGKVAEAVRRDLGLPEGKKIVLYAPTWRDDMRYDAARYKLDLRLDLEAAERALGDDHVLLIRKHHFVSDSVPASPSGFVRDVSAHPDITELMLIADVLITDYSSLMFDFAHTGRPMLFFTYDLEHYRDVLRGFYFDFESRAPGPLLSTSAEVVDALRDLGGVMEASAEAYDTFREAFCDLDDGHAAERVADRLLGQSAL